MHLAGNGGFLGGHVVVSRNPSIAMAAFSRVCVILAVPCSEFGWSLFPVIILFFMCGAISGLSGCVSVSFHVATDDSLLGTLVWHLFLLVVCL